MSEQSEAGPCPSCGNVLLHSAMVTDRFPYGVCANPAILEAEVLMFTCDKCGESWTGEQGEAARADAVKLYLLQIVPQLLAALKAQHEAIDMLFATLIAKTMHAEKPFYPTESGKPWQAIQLGKAAIEAAGGAL